MNPREALARLLNDAPRMKSCRHCGPHKRSRGGWCDAGCGSDHGGMETVVVVPERALDAALAALEAEGRPMLTEGDEWEVCESCGWVPTHPFHDERAIADGLPSAHPYAPPPTSPPSEDEEP